MKSAHPPHRASVQARILIGAAALGAMAIIDSVRWSIGGAALR